MKSIWQKIFPALYGFLIYGTLRIVNDTMGTGFKFWERPIIINIIEFCTVILVGYIFTYVIQIQEKKYFIKNASDITIKRFSSELFRVIAVALIIVNCTIIPMAAVTDDGLSLSDFVQINIIPTLYIVLYFCIRRGNFYVREFISSKLKLQQLENDQLKTELTFLKDQFSPHFLFNGLNNIYFQMDHSVPEAKKSVEKLSELLRYSLYQDQQMLVEINQEIDFINLYAEVHKVRKTDNLVIETNLNHMDGKIYPHLLIPLVENAFKYVDGAHPFIHINLSKNNSQLLFDIKNSKRNIEKDPTKTGIGIHNLKRRLQLLYTDNYELEINNEEEVFTAQLKLPIQ